MAAKKKPDTRIVTTQKLTKKGTPSKVVKPTVTKQTKKEVQRVVAGGNAKSKVNKRKADEVQQVIDSEEAGKAAAKRDMRASGLDTRFMDSEVDAPREKTVVPEPFETAPDATASDLKDLQKAVEQTKSGGFSKKAKPENVRAGKNKQNKILSQRIVDVTTDEFNKSGYFPHHVGVTCEGPGCNNEVNLFEKHDPKKGGHTGSGTCSQGCYDRMRAKEQTDYAAQKIADAKRAAGPSTDFISASDIVPMKGTKTA